MAPEKGAVASNKVDHTVVAVGEPETLLEPVPEERQLHLDFHNISGWVSTHIGPPSLLPSFKSKKQNDDKPEYRQIMHNVSGSCRPGEVLALMGPSGSAKTSVLSVLGGRTPASVKMEGTVLYNGKKLDKKTKRRVGYVLQDDLLYETLTVFETLYFAAMLRLPQKMSTAEKEQRVHTVIKALGLKRCQDTIIGGGFRRGVSGGERKRVSVGHELLIDPSIIFLDEPTSGLDSTTAMHLVTTLRELAAGGRAVVTTIHQPSSRLYLQLDKLLLLSEGHICYYGQARAAADWFGNLGYIMERGINQADFILDIASGDVQSSKLKGADAQQHVIQCADHYLAEHPNGYWEGSKLKEDDFGADLWSAAESRKHLDRTKASLDLSTPSTSSVDDDVEVGKGGKDFSTTDIAPKERYGASYIAQYQILLRRALKVRRFEALSLQDIVQFILVSVLAGCFWLQAGQTDTVFGAQNSNGCIFFLMMYTVMRTMLSALFVFPPEFKMILKERASGMYQISPYYFARTSSDLPIDCSLPTLFVAILYFMGGLRYTPGAFFATWSALILLLLVAQSFGLLVGAIVPIPKTAQTITTVVALVMILTAGFFVFQIPVWIGWMRYLSFIFYGYNLLIKVQYSGRDLWNCGVSTTKWHSSMPEGACTLLPSGPAVQQVLRFNQSPDTWPWEALVLIGFLVGMRFLVYQALAWKSKSTVR
jgi:ABC-type multidrug transport system ATPase subunit